MDLFQQCYDYDEPKFVKALGLYPFFKTISDSEGPRVVIDGKQVVMTGSNNYLGLTHHPRVLASAHEALNRYGTGCTGSRFLNGNLDIHEELEEKLARFVGKEDCLVFSSGFLANLGALAALAEGNPLRIFSDQDNHASLIEGIRLARAKKIIYPHNDVHALENILKQEEAGPADLLVSDGVFSMNGAVAHLKSICALKGEYGFRIYLDDAHGMGVLGRQGRGTADHHDCTDDVDLIFGTFSKSFASLGGFVAGEKRVVEYLRHKARTLIFSAALPPASVMTVLAALEVMQEEPELFQRLWNNVSFVTKRFRDLGYCTLNTSSPIVPVFVGSESLAFRVCKDLFDMGVFATPVIYPAVSYGRALIRTSYMATHTREDLETTISAFQVLKKKYSIPDYEACNLPAATRCFDFSFLAMVS